MFDELGKSGDSYRRIRRLAVLLGVASVLLLIAVYVWYWSNTPPDDYVLFEAVPMSALEMGLFWGGILGVLLAICLFGISVVKQRQSARAYTAKS
jgi:MFS superfamily sulfate permease-like transporter